MFLPTTKEEMQRFGWDKLDIVLVTGDTYIDSPYIGTAVLANLLYKNGYRVGVIAQPDIRSDSDITRLGEPELFWGITAGSLDSMVANYTASKKKRKFDDFTPGGENTRRPDRASIVYSNLVKRYFKNTKPLVLGGIEASLRRIAHYDYWSDSIKRSVLFDAKADIIVYGMAEKAILELALKFKSKAADSDPEGSRYENLNFLHDVKGICYISKEPRKDYIVLPAYEVVRQDNSKFIEMFKLFYDNTDPAYAKGLCQMQDTRYLVQNPPNNALTQKELDEIYALKYERDVHPYYRKQGPTKALETIRFSVATHRGCYGECNFCSISVHQGRTVTSRSEESILNEVKAITGLTGFKGYLSDVGGPTANMYMIECKKKLQRGSCRDKRCLYPKICTEMPLNHSGQLSLLRKIRNIDGIKKVFVASGIRHDMVVEDSKCGKRYIECLVENHISGQLKIAPEHVSPEVLRYMGKPGAYYLKQFKDEFNRINNQKSGYYKKQYLTYYIIAAHPGCSFKDMHALKDYAVRELKITPEQVQVFTPLPSTYSALMYHTCIDPFSGKEMFVEKDLGKRESQKAIVVGRGHYRRRHST
ncbi:MAG: YgiQ family radical SAM protein [Endomicrobiales bacterium]|nr:YgiQ family radical SAM protein [Endomicrobiales bacterium]